MYALVKRYEKKRRRKQLGGADAAAATGGTIDYTDTSRKFYYEFSQANGQKPIIDAFARFRITGSTENFGFLTNERVGACLPSQTAAENIVPDCIAWFDFSSPRCVRPIESVAQTSLTKRVVGVLSSRVNASVKFYAYDSDTTRGLILYDTEKGSIRIPIGSGYKLKSNRLALEGPSQSGGSKEQIDTAPMKFIQAGGQISTDKSYMHATVETLKSLVSIRDENLQLMSTLSSQRVTAENVINTSTTAFNSSATVMTAASTAFVTANNNYTTSTNTYVSLYNDAVNGIATAGKALSNLRGWIMDRRKGVACWDDAGVLEPRLRPRSFRDWDDFGIQYYSLFISGYSYYTRGGIIKDANGSIISIPTVYPNIMEGILDGSFLKTGETNGISSVYRAATDWSRTFSGTGSQGLNYPAGTYAPQFYWFPGDDQEGHDPAFRGHGGLWDTYSGGVAYKWDTLVYEMDVRIASYLEEEKANIAKWQLRGTPSDVRTSIGRTADEGYNGPTARNQENFGFVTNFTTGGYSYRSSQFEMPNYLVLSNGLKPEHIIANPYNASDTINVPVSLVTPAFPIDYKNDWRNGSGFIKSDGKIYFSTVASEGSGWAPLRTAGRNFSNAVTDWTLKNNTFSDRQRTWLALSTAVGDANSTKTYCDSTIASSLIVYNTTMGRLQAASTTRQYLMSNGLHEYDENSLTDYRNAAEFIVSRDTTSKQTWYADTHGGIPELAACVSKAVSLARHKANRLYDQTGVLRNQINTLSGRVDLCIEFIENFLLNLPTAVDYSYIANGNSVSKLQEQLYYVNTFSNIGMGILNILYDECLDMSNTRDSCFSATMFTNGNTAGPAVKNAIDTRTTRSNILVSTVNKFKTNVDQIYTNIIQRSLVSEGHSAPNLEYDTARAYKINNIFIKYPKFNFNTGNVTDQYWYTAENRDGGYTMFYRRFYPATKKVIDITTIYSRAGDGTVVSRTENENFLDMFETQDLVGRGGFDLFSDTVPWGVGASDYGVETIGTGFTTALNAFQNIYRDRIGAAANTSVLFYTMLNASPVVNFDTSVLSITEPRAWTRLMGIALPDGAWDRLVSQFNRGTIDNYRAQFCYQSAEPISYFFGAANVIVTISDYLNQLKANITRRLSYTTHYSAALNASFNARASQRSTRIQSYISTLNFNASTVRLYQSRFKPLYDLASTLNSQTKTMNLAELTSDRSFTNRVSTFIYDAFQNISNEYPNLSTMAYNLRPVSEVASTESSIRKSAEQYFNSPNRPNAGYTDTLVTEYLKRFPPFNPGDIEAGFFRDLQNARIDQVNTYNTIFTTNRDSATTYTGAINTIKTNITDAGTLVTASQTGILDVRLATVTHATCVSFQSTMRYRLTTVTGYKDNMNSQLTVINPFLTELDAQATAVSTAKSVGNITQIEANIGRLAFANIGSTGLSQLTTNAQTILSNIVSYPTEFATSVRAALQTLSSTTLSNDFSTITALHQESLLRTSTIYWEKQGRWEKDPVYHSLVTLARSTFPNDTNIQGVDGYMAANYRGRQIKMCQEITSSFTYTSNAIGETQSTILHQEGRITQQSNFILGFKEQLDAGQITNEMYVNNTNSAGNSLNQLIELRKVTIVSLSTLTDKLEILTSQKALCETNIKDAYNSMSSNLGTGLEETSGPTTVSAPASSQPLGFTAFVVERGSAAPPDDRITVPGSLKGQSRGQILVNPPYLTYTNSVTPDPTNVSQRLVLSGIPNRTLDLNEIIVFNRNLGAQEKDLITAYLAFKWNCLGSVSIANPLFPSAYKLMNSTAADPMRTTFYKLIYRDIDTLHTGIQDGLAAFRRLGCKVKSKLLEVQAENAITGEDVSTETFRALVKGLFQSMVKAEILIDGFVPNYTLDHIKAKLNELYDVKGPVSYYNSQMAKINDLSGDLHQILVKLQAAPAVEASCREVEARRASGALTREQEQRRYETLVIPKQNFRKTQMAEFERVRADRVAAYRALTESWDLAVKQSQDQANALMREVYTVQVSRQLTNTRDTYAVFLTQTAMKEVDAYFSDIALFKDLYLGTKTTFPYLKILDPLVADGYNVKPLLSQLGIRSAADLQGKVSDLYMPTGPTGPSGPTSPARSFSVVSDLPSRLLPLLSETTFSCTSLKTALEDFQDVFQREDYKEIEYISKRLERYQAMYATLNKTIDETNNLQIYYLNTYVYLLYQYMNDIKSMIERLYLYWLAPFRLAIANALSTYPGTVPTSSLTLFSSSIANLVRTDIEREQATLENARAQGTEIVKGICEAKSGPTGDDVQEGGAVTPAPYTYSSVTRERKLKQLNRLDRTIIGVEFIEVDNAGEVLLDENYNAIPINPDILQLKKTSATTYEYDFGPAGKEIYRVVGVYGPDESFTAYFDRQIRPARVDLIIDPLKMARTLIDRKDKNGVIRVNFGEFFRGIELPKYGMSKGDYYVIYNQHPKYPLLVHLPSAGPTVRTVLQPGGISVYIYDSSNDARWYGVKPLNSAMVYDCFRDVPRSRYVGKLKGSGRYVFLEANPTFNEPVLGYLSPVLKGGKMIECRNFDPNPTAAAALKESTAAALQNVIQEKQAIADQTNRASLQRIVDQSLKVYVDALAAIKAHENNTMKPMLMEVNVDAAGGLCADPVDISGVSGASGVLEKRIVAGKSFFPQRRVDLRAYPRNLLPDATDTEKADYAAAIEAYKADFDAAEADGYVVTINPADLRFTERRDCYTVTEYIPKNELDTAGIQAFNETLEEVKRLRKMALEKYKEYRDDLKDLNDYLDEAAAASKEIAEARAAATKAAAAYEERALYSEYGIFYDDDDPNRFFPILVNYLGEVDQADLVLPFGVQSVSIDEDTEPKEIFYMNHPGTSLNIVCTTDEEPGFDAYGFVKVIPGPMLTDGDSLKFKLFPTVTKVTLRGRAAAVGRTGGTYEGFLEFNGSLRPDELYRGTHCIRLDSLNGSLIFCDEEENILFDYTKNAILVPQMESAYTTGSSVSLYDEGGPNGIEINYEEPGSRAKFGVAIKHQEDVSPDLDMIFRSLGMNPQAAKPLTDVIEYTRIEDLRSVIETLGDRFQAAKDYMMLRVDIINTILETVLQTERGGATTANAYIRDITEAKRIYNENIEIIESKRAGVEGELAKKRPDSTPDQLFSIYTTLKLIVEDAEDTIEEIRIANTLVQSIVDKYDVVIRARLNAANAEKRIEATLKRVRELLKEDRARVDYFYEDIGLEYDGKFDIFFNTYNSYIESLRLLLTQVGDTYETILNSSNEAQMNLLSRSILELESRAARILRDAVTLHSSLQPEMDKIDAQLLPYYRQTLRTMAQTLVIQYSKIHEIRRFYTVDRPLPSTTFPTKKDAALALNWSAAFSAIEKFDPVYYTDLNLQRNANLQKIQSIQFPMTIPLLPAEQTGGATGLVDLEGVEANTLDTAEAAALLEGTNLQEPTLELTQLAVVRENQTYFGSLLELQKLFIMTANFSVEEVREDLLVQYVRSVRNKIKGLFTRTAPVRQKLKEIEVTYNQLLDSYYATVLPRIIPTLKDFVADKQARFMELYNRGKAAEASVQNYIQFYRLESSAPDPIIFSGQRREILQNKEAIRLLFDQTKNGFRIENAKAYIEGRKLYLEQDFNQGPFKILDLESIWRITEFFAADKEFEKTIENIVKKAIRVDKIVRSALVVVDMRTEMDDISDPMLEMEDDPQNIEAELSELERGLEVSYRTSLQALIRERRLGKVAAELTRNPENSLAVQDLSNADSFNQGVNSTLRPEPPCEIGPEMSIRECFKRRYPHM